MEQLAIIQRQNPSYYYYKAGHHKSQSYTNEKSCMTKKDLKLSLLKKTISAFFMNEIGICSVFGYTLGQKFFKVPLIDPEYDWSLPAQKLPYW